MADPVSRLMAQVPVVSAKRGRPGIHDHEANGADSRPLILRLHAPAGLVCVTFVPSGPLSLDGYTTMSYMTACMWSSSCPGS